MSPENLISSARKAERSGDFEKATEIYRKVVREYPNTQQAQDAKRDLLEINERKQPTEVSVNSRFQIGKIITYDGATGNGMILLLGGQKQTFNVDSWQSTSAIPEVGLDVKVSGNGIVSPKASAKERKWRPTIGYFLLILSAVLWLLLVIGFLNTPDKELIRLIRLGTILTVLPIFFGFYFVLKRESNWRSTVGYLLLILCGLLLLLSFFGIQNNPEINIKSWIVGAVTVNIIPIGLGLYWVFRGRKIESIKPDKPEPIENHSADESLQSIEPEHKNIEPISTEASRNIAEKEGSEQTKKSPLESELDQQKKEPEERPGSVTANSSCAAKESGIPAPVIGIAAAIIYLLSVGAPLLKGTTAIVYWLHEGGFIHVMGAIALYIFSPKLLGK